MPKGLERGYLGILADILSGWHVAFEDLGATSLADWYYSDGGEPNGPHGEEDVRSLLIVGQLTPDALVWRDGMPQWVAIKSVPEFGDLFKTATPPPLPPRPPVVEPAPAVISPPIEPVEPEAEEWSVSPPDAVPSTFGNSALAGPWTRYFARSFDLSLISTIIATGITLALPYVNMAWALQWYYVDARVLFLLLLPVTHLVNGIIVTLFGNSAGRAIFGIKAMPLDGRPKMSLDENIRREFSVWSQGLAFGIPIVNFFTMVPAFRLVNKGLPTTYDLGRVSVRDYSRNAIRRSIGMLLTLALLAGILFLNAAEKMDQRQLQSTTRWSNPQTGVSTTIPAGWHYEIVTGPEANTIYSWTNLRTGVVALFAFESGPGITMDAYQEGIKLALADSIPLGAWTAAGGGVSTASGIAAPEGYPATMYVTQRGEMFWRIVYMDQISKAPRQIMEPTLTSALLATIN